jgi:hypothetical protein
VCSIPTYRSTHARVSVLGTWVRRLRIISVPVCKL